MIIILQHATNEKLKEAKKEIKKKDSDLALKCQDVNIVTYNSMHYQREAEQHKEFAEEVLSREDQHFQITKSLEDQNELLNDRNEELEPQAAEALALRQKVDQLVARLEWHGDHDCVDRIMNQEGRQYDSQGSIVDIPSGGTANFLR